jgi:hypothetical protein
MTEQQINNALAFLNRVQLNAQEIQAFLDVVNAITAQRSGDPHADDLTEDTRPADRNV